MFFRLQVKKQLAGRRLWSQLATVLPCFHPRQRGALERRPYPSSATSRMPVCSTFPSRFKTQWRMRGFSTRSTETTGLEQLCLLRGFSWHIDHTTWLLRVQVLISACLMRIPSWCSIVLVRLKSPKPSAMTALQLPQNSELQWNGHYTVQLRIICLIFM